MGLFPATLVCKVAYIEGIKYVNLIEIGLVDLEIRGIENGELVVLVNNTLVCHMALLATDIQPYVLIMFCCLFMSNQVQMLLHIL